MTKDDTDIERTDQIADEIASLNPQAKHTPGPWTIRIDLEKRYERHVILSSGDEVAKLVRYPGEPLIAGDARLIAAAPDMLKALKQIYETIRDPNRGELYLGALRAVENAIAKAEAAS